MTKRSCRRSLNLGDIQAITGKGWRGAEVYFQSVCWRDVVFVAAWKPLLIALVWRSDLLCRAPACVVGLLCLSWCIVDVLPFVVFFFFFYNNRESSAAKVYKRKKKMARSAPFPKKRKVEKGYCAKTWIRSAGVTQISFDFAIKALKAFIRGRGVTQIS